jgi:hypothetical protein
MMDPVALKIQNLIPATTNNNPTLNWLPSITTNTQQQIPSVKIDHSLGDRTKLSFYWTQQHTNQIAGPDGLPDPLTGQRPKLVEGNQYRINADRTVSPSLVVHVGIGFYRFLNPDSSGAGVLNYDAVGQLGLVGSASNPAGFPNLTNLSVNNLGGAPNFGPNTADHQFTDKLSGVSSVMYVRGSHTYKLGLKWKQDVYSD